VFWTFVIRSGISQAAARAGIFALAVAPPRHRLVRNLRTVEQRSAMNFAAMERISRGRGKRKNSSSAIVTAVEKLGAQAAPFLITSA